MVSCEITPQLRAHAQNPHNVERVRKNGGFTLIELVVVLVIIGLLATVVAPNLFSRVDDARITKARADISSIEQALSLYKLDNFQFPSTSQGLNALVQQPSGDPPAPNWREYLSKIPADPWGNGYRYRYPGKFGEMDLYSMGPNGAEDDQSGDDIGNWQ